ncbi:MAG: hypothetical protein V9F04_14770 [Dermatophilaceae bacterium]
MTDRGLLLLHGDADRVVSWARRGLVAVSVLPLSEGWVAVVPDGPLAAAQPPYEDALGVLLARPVPRRLCPALGLAHVGGRLVVAVTSAAIKTRRMWLAWEPGVGLIRPGALPITTVATLARSVGAPAAVDRASRLLRDARGDSGQVAGELLTVLGLPGVALAAAPPDDIDRMLAAGRRVVPDASGVRRFDRRMSDDSRWREEVGA